MTLRDILTPRQFQAAGLVRRYLNNQQVAAAMGLRPSSIEQVLRNAYERADCVSGSRGASAPRVELAVRFALEESEGKYKGGK